MEISNQQIGQELVMTKDKLIATEQCKEMMGCQLDKVTGELEECKEKFTVQSNVANDLTGRIAHLEYEKSTQELVIFHYKSPLRVCCLTKLYFDIYVSFI